MKQAIIAIMMVLALSVLVSAGGPNPVTSIWTTDGSCGGEQQDVNHYGIGDAVYINGKTDATEGNYVWDWTITGGAGGSSCDSGAVVASGSAVAVDSNGTFCFEAYTVADDDCGEYKVDVNKKNDNYRVDEPAVPEFGVMAAGIALVGATGMVFFARRK